MRSLLYAVAALAVSTLPALAEWRFSDGQMPIAFIQTNNMTLELQCDRIRFAPAGYEDSQDIVAKQAMSIRFMKNGATEVGAFQVGQVNATVEIVDNYPVEVVFSDPADYSFVLDQIAANAVLNLSMVDQDISYGIFDLKGSAAAIRSLRGYCGNNNQASSSQGGVGGAFYCGPTGEIEYVKLGNVADEWDARVTHRGNTLRAMTSYSYFGNSQPPQGFEVALLGEDRSEFLVFNDGGREWIEFGDGRYDKCN